MAEISITDGYITSASADDNTALGASSVQADTLIVVAHKASETETPGRCTYGRWGGQSRYPWNPGTC